MTQTDKVKAAVQAGCKTIQAVFDFTGAGDIPRPSIRRVLGQGAKKGIFKRVDTGIYTLTTTEGETRAYIECAKAEDALPRLAAAGNKYDMVFLDIAYFSKGLIGGNRGIKKYDFLYPEQFAAIMREVYKMMRTDDSHVYIMLSQAPSVQMDMHKYIFAALESGFKEVVNDGKYYKTYKDGSPVTNVKGNKAASERLILLSRSGKVRECEAPLQMTFTCERPPVATSYPTQKAEPFITQLIRQSTFENDVILDPCAGSGVMGKCGKCGLLLNRVVHMVEVLDSAIQQFILPKLQPFIL